MLSTLFVNCFTSLSNLDILFLNVLFDEDDDVELDDSRFLFFLVFRVFIVVESPSVNKLIGSTSAGGAVTSGVSGATATSSVFVEVGTSVVGTSVGTSVLSLGSPNVVVLSPSSVFG